MQQVQMAFTNRRGRKRKSGYRQPNGQLQRKTIDYAAMAAEQPHRRGLPASQRLSHEAETELGRMYLRHQITEPMLLAGQEYAHRMGRYLATIGGPRATAGNGSWSGCNPEACDPDECLCKRRELDYLELQKLLVEQGRRVERMVNRVAVYGEIPYGYGINILIIGLSTLARHMRISQRGR